MPKKQVRGRKGNRLGVRMWYAGIRVKDLEGSLRFYREALGFNVIFRGRMHTHEGTYVQMSTPTGKQILELNWYPETSEYFEPYKNGSELDHLGFYVSDVKAQYERLLRCGCESAVKPFNHGVYDLAFVKDPNGIWLELMGRAKRKKRD
ncbi:MAG: VOC family protein [Euryarchaeota archaeon]|nr:VOC family protein [Euryarchaeota archaeon]